VWRLSCTIIEGYGQTECTAAATLTLPNDVRSAGHVGVPLPCNDVKLVSVEDMGYRYDDKFHMRALDKVRACRRLCRRLWLRPHLCSSRLLC
jgi:long-subunit acyl-CoA synthetase (AMP-forming)